MRNRKTNEKCHCIEWWLWFFLLLICWHNTIRGFKEVKENKGTKLLYVSQSVRKWWQLFPMWKGAKKSLLKCDAYKGNHESELKSDCATGKQVKQVAMLVSVIGLFSQWNGNGETSSVYLLAQAVSLSVTRSCICQEDDCWQKVCWRGGACVPRF